MNKKIVGLILIVLGIALTAWGFNVYNAAGAEISRALSGNSPIEAWLGMALGAVLVIVGGFKLK